MQTHNEAEYTAAVQQLRQLRQLQDDVMYTLSLHGYTNLADNKGVSCLSMMTLCMLRYRGIISDVVGYWASWLPFKAYKYTQDTVNHFEIRSISFL